MTLVLSASYPSASFRPRNSQMTSATSQRRHTRSVRVGKIEIGGNSPIAVQSMCATKTRDIDATVAQTMQLKRAGAAVVRIAIDNDLELEALKEIRRQTDATLAVDLQENYRLASKVGPFVDKIRYNPGHLHHVERSKSVADKVAWLAGAARDSDCAMRIGVNCGSIAPMLRNLPSRQR